MFQFQLSCARFFSCRCIPMYPASTILEIVSRTLLLISLTIIACLVLAPHPSKPGPAEAEGVAMMNFRMQSLSCQDFQLSSSRCLSLSYRLNSSGQDPSLLQPSSSWLYLNTLFLSLGSLCLQQLRFGGHFLGMLQEFALP